MVVQPDFKELAALLNAHKVEYVIVGAFALAHYGVPRMTGDIDFLVQPGVDNGARIVSALDEFGFGSLGLKPEDFSELDLVVQLGVPPVRIDILTSLSGVTWEEVAAGRVTGQLDGIPVFYLGRDQFIQNKRASGRKKDLGDIEALGES